MCDLKKLIKLMIPGLIGSIVGLVGIIVTNMSRTNILIERGMDGFRFQLTLFEAITAFGGTILAASLVFGLIKEIKTRKAAKKQDVKLLEADRPKAMLSFETGRLDEEQMRSLLLESFDAVEPEFIEHLETYQTQMDKMNMYQARLHRMLAINGIKDLQETEFLLDKLEQSMFGNLRKAFNWINMRGSTKEAKEKLHANLSKVSTDNQTVLDKASELCNVLTEYINNQGNTTYSVVVFDNFIKSLNEQLEEI